MTLTKDDFPIGARVRAVKFPTPDVVGTTGVVVHPAREYGQSDQYVFVERDGRGTGDDFPFRPGELEIVSLPTIPRPFAIGDRVRLADDDDFFSSLAAGKTGTVSLIDSAGNIRVDIDGEDFCQHDIKGGPHLTLIEPDEPTTAATLRTRADALHAQFDEVNDQIDTLVEKRDALRTLASQYRAVASDLEAQQ